MEYACHAYNEDLPKGKASGHVVLGQLGFTFLINDKRIQVPFNECELELGGAGDRILFIRHPRQKQWTFYSSERQLLADPLLKDHPDIRQQASKVRRKRTTTAVVVSLVTFMIIAPPILLLLNMDWISGKVATKVPVEWEQTLGESAIEQYTISTELLEEDETSELLDPLVQPLLEQIQANRYQYHFYIALDSTPNAFALPGGYVVLHTELISMADNAEELLGVIAHEINHVEQQHGVRSVIGTAGVYTLFTALFGDVNGILSLVVGAAPYLLNQSYSRDYEREADILGYELLVGANIDPRGLPSFFRKIMAEEQEMYQSIDDEQTRNTLEKAMSFISTHPASEERVAYLEELAEQSQGEYRDFSVEFESLKQAIELFVAENQEQE